MNGPKNKQKQPNEQTTKSSSAKPISLSLAAFFHRVRSSTRRTTRLRNSPAIALFVYLIVLLNLPHIIEMKKSEPAVATSTKIKFDDSDDHESSSEDEIEIERELADVTFEELQRARSDGTDLVYRKPKPEKKGGRANKNRPMEISSKKPVSRFREVIQVPKKVVRDPRFESLCGDLNVEGHKKRYNFIYENTLPAEKEELKKQMKKTKDPEAVNELKDRMTRIDKELKSVATKRTEKDILAEHKKKERVAAKKGKQPYYLKKSEIQKQKLAEKFKELKELGKLESFIEKKRRRNAAKDHRFMPYRRPAEQDNL